MINAIWQREGPRRALVTGAGSGVGEALARLLAEEGWELILTGGDESELFRVAGVVRGKFGVDVHVLLADLARREEIVRLFGQLQRRDLMPDVLVHATDRRLAGKAAEIPREEQLRLMDLCMRATADLTLRLLPHLRAQKAGGLLLLASPGALLPGPGRAAYHACGAWMLSFGEALAEELRVDGVNVSVLCQGVLRAGGKTGRQGQLMAKLLPAMRPDFVARTAWRGFREGRVIIVPGLLNRLLLIFSRLLPRSVARRLAAWLMRQ